MTSHRITPPDVSSVQWRVPLWAAMLLAWALQTCNFPWGRCEPWRPEWLLLILTFAALRATPSRGALMGLAAGWMVVACTPTHAWLLLGFWVFAGYGLGWLRTQWHTEGRGLFLAVSWIIVMAWHGCTWLIKSSGETMPRAWDLSFVVTQTAVTLAGAAIWQRYGQQFVRIPIAAMGTGAVAFLHPPTGSGAIGMVGEQEPADLEDIDREL